MEHRTLHNLEFAKVLDRLAGFAVSEAGIEACRSITPCETIDDARRETALFHEGLRWLQSSGFKLINFPALDGLLDFVKGGGGALDLDDLVALRHVLSQADGLVRSIEGEKRNPADAPHWPILNALVDRYPWPRQVWGGLTRCISDEGYIREEASPDLLLIRQEIRRIHQNCTRKVKEFVGKHNLLAYLQDEYITLASDRYVLPLRTNFKGRVQGIIHDYSQTGETCYFEPLFLVDMNNELQELKQQEREEERRILEYLTQLVRSQHDSVASVYDLLVLVDIIQSKKRLADAFDGTPLDLNDDAPLMLLKARHPLLALTKDGALPVDLELRQGQQALVISGGNAGGKTVCLKTIGLIALMAMSGLPVPVAAGSTMPLWTTIYAFIGDEQSLEDNVSTFTAQIRHLSTAWDRIGPETLVILDEFGAGTDPAQGAALAQAVIDELLEKGACITAATHFPALKAYALSHDKVRAASVLFDPSTKRPLYRLAYDQVGASQALDVAREHGMPEAVLKRAESYLLIDGEDTTALIDRLNALAVEREKEMLKLESERSKFADRKAKLEARFERDREKLFTQVQNQAQSVLREWREGKVSHKQALKELSKTREQLVKQEETNVSTARELALEDVKPGDILRYLPWGKKGKVEEVDARKKRIKIDLSGVSMWAGITDLAATGDRPVTKKVTETTVKADKTSSLRVDLRGMRADVAISELTRFIDKALLGSMTELEVVHGKGTGALRKEVHRFLREYPAVSSFRLAPEDLGGDGMTIVELR